MNPKHCDAVRELSVAYLKLSMPYECKPIFNRAVECDADTWQPWRGYLYLYLYIDYQNSIADFNASYTLTPDDIDSPQGQTLDYWRGHAYLGAKDYKKRIFYYQKYIVRVTKEWGGDWVEPDAFLNLAILEYGKEAGMHLHLWNPSARKKGLCLIFLNWCVSYYFNILN